MRDETAIVKNISKLQEAFNAAMTRDSGVEGMVVIHGKTGAGKTTAISWLVTQLKNNDIHPIWVEASPAWSLKSMLADICRACMIDPKGNSAELAAAIKEQMLAGRPLFIDEVDHLFLPGSDTTLRMIEQIRSLYDFSKTPVVLIGMDKLERKPRRVRIAHLPRRLLCAMRTLHGYMALNLAGASPLQQLVRPNNERN